MAKSSEPRRAPDPSDDNSRVKARDVALVANVSVSAVSRTFTPGASVSAATRARVLAIADQLGYRPNILARGLTTRRTNLVGVVMPRVQNPFFEQFLGKLNHGLAEQGQRTLLLLIDGRSEADQALEHALDYSVDGLVFFNSSPSPASAARAWRAGVPIVAMDKGEDLPNSAYVWLDGGSIGRKVANIFIAEGRRSPLAIAGARGKPYAKELVAFAAAMQAATGRATPLLEADPRYEDGVAIAMDVLAGADRPDAIFTSTDVLALGIYDAAKHKLGLDLPKALSIIGNGDTGPANWLSHPLSTVRPPIDTLVSTAVAALMARIADPSLPAINSYIDCEIVRRATTLPAASPTRDGPKTQPKRGVRASSAKGLR